MQYWLIKSEPDVYSWTRFMQEKRTFWDGVRNYQARNNLKAMKAGDLALYYHSNEERAVVGIATIVKEAYPDPTTDDPNWVCVDVSPVQPLKRPVPLAEIKSDSLLKDMQLVRQSRLSVLPVTESEYRRILQLSGT